MSTIEASTVVGPTAAGPVAGAVGLTSPRPPRARRRIDPATLTGGTTDARTGLHSALYEGTLHHARIAPPDGSSPSHAFTYDVLMAWLDLGELPGALGAHPLWSARFPAPIRFRRRDFHGDPRTPLAQAVRDTVERELGSRPSGPIRMLATLRTWGWSFNPIAFYFAFAPDGVEVEALVAEVTNTPWHERHAYVMAVHADEVATPVRFPKALHVSPFLGLDLDHALSFTRPGDPTFTIRMDDWRGDERTFAATLRLQRAPLDRPTMGAALRRHPLPAQKVSAGIYWEALKLRLAGAPFRHHPAKAGKHHRSSSATPPAATTTDAPCPRSHP